MRSGKVTDIYQHKLFFTGNYRTSILCQSDSVEASDCSVDEIVQKNSSNSSVRNQNDSRDNAGDAEVVGFPRMAFQSGVRIIQEMILGLHQCHNPLFALEAPILNITCNLMLKRERRHGLCISIIGAAPIGEYAKTWEKYVGVESHVYCKYPLHLEWGDEHNRSFDDFFIRCQKDYEFLPLDPNQPLSRNIVYRGMKSQLQERVRYNRCQVKQECFEVWKNTPEAEREALWTIPAFSWIDRDSWANLCAYYDSEDKKDEARRNAQNRASNLHG
ncbi:uncharacterized protein A4U43_C07F21630 [Asparagus officinalis]|uniref:Uncharacterized protein n=1 Tax=Asparagus officinalis TaxID=4686 RepID=A0A5P1EDT1_ASPOF|nr:uncharacterized protein A4U43_C07F21630 [Asparagus officinalis]